MREIKCRAKRIDNGEWTYGSYVFQEGWHYIVFVQYLGDWCIDCGCPCVDWHLVDANTVGQYTGLKDKNGKEIFEGDVFEFDDEVWESAYTSCGTEWGAFNVKNRAVIGFDEDAAKYDFTSYRFNENSVRADLHENHDLDFADFVQGLEIIGNIHENPELLEVE